MKRTNAFQNEKASAKAPKGKKQKACVVVPLKALKSLFFSSFKSRARLHVKCKSI